MMKYLRIAYRRIKQFFQDIFLQTIIACSFFVAFMISFSVTQFLMTAHVHSGTVITLSDWQKTIIKGTGKRSHDRDGWEREIIIRLDDNTQIVKSHTTDIKEENNFYNTHIGQEFDVVQSDCYSYFCPHNSIRDKSTNPDYWQRPFAYVLYLFDQNIAELCLFFYWAFCGITNGLLLSFKEGNKYTSPTFWVKQSFITALVFYIFIFDSPLRIVELFLKAWFLLLKAIL